MPVTVIAQLTLNEDAPEDLGAYFAVTAPLLHSAGARIVKRFTLGEAVIGTAPAKLVVVVEYPSREAVRQVFDSAEYASIVPVRDKAFHDYSVSIAEGDVNQLIETAIKS